MKNAIHNTSTNRLGLYASLLGAAIAIATTTARAQGVLFTDRSAFNAVLQTSSSFDFENLTPTVGPAIPMPTAQNIITVPTPPIPNARLTITGSQLFVYPQSYSSPGVPASSGNYVGTFDSNIPMTIAFPGGRNAFAADFSGGLGSTFTGSLTFNLVDGSSQSFQFTGSANGWTFMGAVFPKGINNVVFDDGGPSFPGSHEERIDNVTYGTAVPEPTFAALLLIGGFSSALLGRKRG